MLKLTPKLRLPETTRAADQLVCKAQKAALKCSPLGLKSLCN
ncbi:hypothetical protein [Flocculibacter collagenilyticus]